MGGERLVANLGVKAAEEVAIPLLKSAGLISGESAEASAAKELTLAAGQAAERGGLSEALALLSGRSTPTSLKLMSGEALTGASSHEAAQLARIYQHELPVAHEFLDVSKFGPTFLNANATAPVKEVASRGLASMTTPFKVLTQEGASPGAHSVKWPLPELQSNGVWKPGKWLHLEETPLDAYRLAGNGAVIPSTRRALHVSNVQGRWTLGQSNLRVFEAELSAGDQMLWNRIAGGAHSRLAISTRLCPRRCATFQRVSSG